MATTPTVLPVTVSGIPDAAGTITGTATVCSGTTGVPYSVATIPNATVYVWVIPTGVSIASGSGTNAITLNWNAVSGPQTISVYGNNLCGNGQVSPDFSVQVTPLPATPVITEAGYVLSSDAVAGNQWYWNGISILGATAQTYTALFNGDYWDVVTLNNCVSDPSNHISILTIGVNEQQSGTISVYPNPNNGHFTFTSSMENGTLELYNIIGSMVYSAKVEKHESIVDLSSQPRGIYFAKYSSGQSIRMEKIVIQ
jgi:hypothetical protein